MPNTITGLPGGANVATTGTDAVAIDLSEFVGQRVKIWSDDADLYFCFAPDGSSTTLVTAAQAASANALVADRAGKGVGVPRRVTRANPFLVAGHVTSPGAGMVRVKPIAQAEP